MNTPLKRIGIIELGGTINSLSEQPSSEFYDGPISSISSFIKELDLKDDPHVFIEALTQKISHEITVSDLIKIANRIQILLDQDDCHGIVVTMGTNALEDVAYFIGLVIKTKKPIVFTGAHYPQNSLIFDGKRNLFNAICIAKDQNAESLGVLVTFNDYVVAARDAVKNNPGLINNFSTEGIGVIGHVIGGKLILKSKPIYRHTYRSEFSLLGKESIPKIAIIYSHLGISDVLVNAAIDNGISGIISAGFGKGYQPSYISDLLKKAVDSGIPVVRCSRSGYGYTSIDKNYDEKYGLIVAKGLSQHKSSLLLSLSLTVTPDANRIQKIFEEY
ncbi:asparaginase [Legionella nautarum]|uniref:asparaginase n=1 Tax=Legionella nautarum TaxID=45070 RepID=UPI00105448EF|nr:asparaginase [Legionella nautarum]